MLCGCVSRVRAFTIFQNNIFRFFFHIPILFNRLGRSQETSLIFRFFFCFILVIIIDSFIENSGRFSMHFFLFSVFNFIAFYHDCNHKNTSHNLRHLRIKLLLHLLLVDIAILLLSTFASGYSHTDSTEPCLIL